MTAELSLIPAAVGAASGVIERHAVEVASAGGNLESSADSVGAAALAAHNAFQDFCTALSERLSAAAAKMAEASVAFRVMECTNAESLSSIVIRGEMSVRQA